MMAELVFLIITIQNYIITQPVAKEATRLNIGYGVVEEA
jgi:hypothetical protein